MNEVVFSSFTLVQFTLLVFAVFKVKYVSFIIYTEPLRAYVVGKNSLGKGHGHILSFTNVCRVDG